MTEYLLEADNKSSVMPYQYLIFLIIFLIITIPIGCATSNAKIGIQYLEQKNYATAIAAFDSAAAKKPDPQIYFGYFEAYMSLNNYENAFKYLTIGLTKYPNDAWLNLCAGHWYMKKGNNAKKALGYYEKAKKIRFGKSENIMKDKINAYIDKAKDQIAVDSLENNLKDYKNYREF